MVGAQYLHNTGRRIHRHRTLFDDNLTALRTVGNHARRVLDVLQIGGAAVAIAKGFRWRVDGYKDELGLLDGLLDVGGEEEIHVAALFDDTVKAGLKTKGKI